VISISWGIPCASGLRYLPLTDRNHRLRGVTQSGERLLYCDHVEGAGHELFDLLGLREASDKARPQSQCSAIQESCMRRGTCSCEAAVLTVWLVVMFWAVCCGDAQLLVEHIRGRSRKLGFSTTRTEYYLQRSNFLSGNG